MKAKQVQQTEQFQPPDTCGKCKFARDSWDDGALTLTCKNDRAHSYNERVRPLQLACRVFSDNGK